MINVVWGYNTIKQAFIQMQEPITRFWELLLFRLPSRLPSRLLCNSSDNLSLLNIIWFKISTELYHFFIDYNDTVCGKQPVCYII